MNQSPAVDASCALRKTRVRVQNGFTIIELLVVLTIGAVLAVIAVPSMRDMLNTTRQSSALGLIVNDLNQARGEAIKRNARMLICVRNTPGTDCATGTNWQAGWVVCMDAVTTATGLPPSDGQCDATSASDPNPIAVRPALDPSLTLTAAAGPIVQFNPNSAVAAPADFDIGGVWAGAVSRKVCILRTGNMLKLPPPPGSQVCPL
jgi:prepilin-type N-terminal cleavage/methylation domain-containing protein